MVDKLEQSWATVNKEYCQNEGQKKTCRKKKKPVGKKSAENLGSIHDSCSEKLILYEGYTAWKSPTSFPGLTLRPTEGFPEGG